MQINAAATKDQTRDYAVSPTGASKVRFVVVGLCFVGLVMNYLDRANLSVALPYMDKDLGLGLTNTQKGLILVIAHPGSAIAS